MIQLIATDIDGTLLDENRFISERTASVFKSVDLPKILISARMPQAMYYLQEALDIQGAPMICYNGALVLHQDERLYEISIAYDEIKALADIGRSSHLHVAIYRDQEWFVPVMDHWSKREEHNTRVTPQVQPTDETLSYFKDTQEKGGAHKVMFMGEEKDMDVAFAKAEHILGNKVHLYRSKNTYTEITPKGTSKKVALEKLLQANYPQIKLSGVAAFGDNYNDTEMLAAVGYGVAVENARKEVLEAAGYHTGHHKKDGVAAWLSAHLKI
ncbi:Cof-type HAD-IIB family hydrolase [Nonlabens xiamenensis]|uniref:Cof-type HAD-IIB family hydrolase n=1 Tax=Nonlabens xiamenensis TaxID=2341043 RepID=UPI000F60EF9D|nr:Cof-type HAD-IIB family hydrolase [Nonlabens xiamenensis]